ncbi:MAG TPA: ubiquitin-conjugating enzyme E2 [Pirellulaceae bacterium]|nr:ubiquitin-conjugating enzyme E2 [Pirellulaceae bacterium]HMO92335.1 ubiquitin-conjugating enzyme E2 [Pirellulaceae bacterium]HMP69259.1 ubiquitin-conjugating enzyme E2 [Pirellulaceae bacterium]
MSDHRALQSLASESSIFSFDAKGTPPEMYRLVFRGLGAQRINHHEVSLAQEHIVIVELSASYPRMAPALSWQTPIFHPNISSGGVVCLGGYGTHWVPSLTLDELCNMLWDMIRYKNFDTESPYNRDAAIWAKNQSTFRFPLDQRPLRDLVAFCPKTGKATTSIPPAVMQVENMIEYVDAQVVEEAVSPRLYSGEDVVFID